MLAATVLIMAFVWPPKFQCERTDAAEPPVEAPYFYATPYCRPGTECNLPSYVWICEDQCHVPPAEEVPVE